LPAETLTVGPVHVLQSIETSSLISILFIMRGDSLLRTINKGRMEGKKKRGRPRMMLLDWMMKEDYSKLKEKA